LLYWLESSQPRFIPFISFHFSFHFSFLQCYLKLHQNPLGEKKEVVEKKDDKKTKAEKQKQQKAQQEVSFVY
jgi:hypothetical protein